MTGRSINDIHRAIRAIASARNVNPRALELTFRVGAFPERDSVSLTIFLVRGDERRRVTGESADTITEAANNTFGDIAGLLADGWSVWESEPWRADKSAVSRCGACFRPGVLVPPDQPRRAGRCRLARGHAGDHDFPLLDEVSP